MGNVCSSGGRDATHQPERRRSVRIAPGGSLENVFANQNVVGPASLRGTETTYYGKDDDIPEDAVPYLVRQFTQKAMSVDNLARCQTGLNASAQRPRRESHIDDKDVLRLIASKSKNPRDFDAYQEVAENDASIERVNPDLAKRLERRRKTMEAVDVFSPDAANDRVEELYEASEKLEQRSK